MYIYKKCCLFIHLKIFYLFLVFLLLQINLLLSFVHSICVDITFSFFLAKFLGVCISLGSLEKRNQENICNKYLYRYYIDRYIEG